MRIAVHYCHGLESGPNGYKARAMRSWFSAVRAPDQQMSLWRPDRRNAVSVAWLRRPWRGLPGAVSAARDGCVAAQESALDGTATVLVGSSWGGLIAAVLLAEGTWTGPTVLLCPAVYKAERWMWPGGPRPDDARTAARLIAQLAALPDSARQRVVVVHGAADKTIPLSDSERLCAQAGLPLRTIAGGSHGLGSIVRDETLRQIVEGVHG